jgi:hypothetical protein
VKLHDLTIRPMRGRDEHQLFCRFPYDLNEEVAGDLDDGHRHPEWLWVALRCDRLVARAGWWGRHGVGPESLDILDVDDTDPDAIEIGVELLNIATAAVVPTGSTPPEYTRYVRPDWRDRPDSALVVRTRMAVVERTGGRLLVERLRLEWRSGPAFAPAAPRLRFRPFADSTEVLALTTLALEETLDAHSRRDMTSMTAAQAARSHLR